MDRPVIPIKLKPIDFVFEIVAALIIVYMWFIGIAAYIRSNSFASQFINHINTIRSLIIINIFLGSILYVGLTLITRIPQSFNYPEEITEENAEYQYTRANKILRLVKIGMLVIFLFLTKQLVGRIH